LWPHCQNRLFFLHSCCDFLGTNVRINFYYDENIPTSFRKKSLFICTFAAYFEENMRTYLLFISLCLGLLIGCNDGDYTVERITFTGTEAHSCIQDTTTTFLYKIQGSEALILQFRANLLKNKVDSISGNIGNGYTLLYRTFDSAPTATYFCTSPPQTTPKVTSEIQAQGGTVIITTREVRDTIAGTVKYNHLIRIRDLVLTNENGERLVDQNFNFGTYQTSR